MQCVATVKYASDRSVYRVIKEAIGSKQTALWDFELRCQTEISNCEIRLFPKLCQYILFTPVLQQVWPVT